MEENYTARAIQYQPLLLDPNLFTIFHDEKWKLRNLSINLEEKEWITKKLVFICLRFLLMKDKRKLNHHTQSLKNQVSRRTILQYFIFVFLTSAFFVIFKLISFYSYVFFVLWFFKAKFFELILIKFSAFGDSLIQRIRVLFFNF